MVARRNPQLLEEAIEIVREGNFKEGYSLHNGWGSAGYGGFVGGEYNTVLICSTVVFVPHQLFQSLSANSNGNAGMAMEVEQFYCYVHSSLSFVSLLGFDGLLL